MEPNRVQTRPRHTKTQKKTITQERTQEKVLNGNYVLTHTYPVPSDWLLDLEQAGIDCFSFLPVTGFHCEVQEKSIDELGFPAADFEAEGSQPILELRHGLALQFLSRGEVEERR